VIIILYGFRSIVLEILTGEVGKLMERDVRIYSEWLGCEIAELNVQTDHVNVVVSIPPKVSVSTYMGTVKGKAAIKIFKSYPMLKKEAILG
jgi:putative transposase